MMQQELARPSMYCRQCGYALWGLSENRCPECGRAFDPADPRTFFRHPRSYQRRRWIKRIVLALTMVVLLAAIFVAACFGWVYWQYHADWQAEQEALAALRAAAGQPAFLNISSKQLGSGPLYQVTVPWDYLRDRVRSIGMEGQFQPKVNLAQLARFKQCTKIGLVNMGITDDQLIHLESLTQLTDLDLAENPAITDGGLAHLRGLTAIAHLDLERTSVSGVGFRYIQGMTGLCELRLGGTRVQGRDLAQLKAFPALDFLQLEGLLIADADLVHLRPLPLRYVYLQRTGITNAGLAELGKLIQLEGLKLSGTGITDAGLQQLARLPSLTMLFLDDTLVTDAGLKHLEGLSNLRELLVRRTQVTPEGIRKLKETLPSLQVDGP